jgi:hypothetical protein
MIPVDAVRESICSKNGERVVLPEPEEKPKPAPYSVARFVRGARELDGIRLAGNSTWAFYKLLSLILFPNETVERGVPWRRERWEAC